MIDWCSPVVGFVPGIGGFEISTSAPEYNTSSCFINSLNLRQIMPAGNSSASSSLFGNYGFRLPRLQINQEVIAGGIFFLGGVSVAGATDTFLFGYASLFLGRFLTQVGWTVPEGALSVEQMLIMMGRNDPAGAHALSEVLRSANYSDDIFSQLVRSAARGELESSISAARTASNGTFTYRAYTETIDDVGRVLAQSVREAETSAASAGNVRPLPVGGVPAAGGAGQAARLVGMGLTGVLVGFLGAILMEVTWRAMQEREMYRNDQIA